MSQEKRFSPPLFHYSLCLIKLSQLSNIPWKVILAHGYTLQLHTCLWVSRHTSLSSYCTKTEYRPQTFPHISPLHSCKQLFQASKAHQVRAFKLFSKDFHNSVDQKHRSRFFSQMWQTRSIAIAWKNLVCVILVIENGWLSAVQFQVPISWGGLLTASDKDRCPYTLLSHFQVSLGSDSGPLTTCHCLAGWDCWKGNAASKLLMSPNGKPLISGIQVL